MLSPSTNIHGVPPREGLKKSSEKQQTMQVAYKHVDAKPHVRPHPKDTAKQYRILVIRGGMKTLAARRDFDCCYVGFRV